MTLLIVDPDQRSRLALQTLFAERYRTIPAHGAFPAIRFLERGAIDVLLVKTPQSAMTAIALLTWLRSCATRVSTIVLLGRHASDEADRIRRLGANVVRRWPISDTELLLVVAVSERIRRNRETIGVASKLRQNQPGNSLRVMSPFSRVFAKRLNCSNLRWRQPAAIPCSRFTC